MVQVDVPVAFAVGSLFADAASRQLQTNQPRYYLQTLAMNNIYLIFFFSWVPVYFLLNYFGWETTHMWWHADAVTAYPFYLPIFIVVFFAAGNLGFLLGAKLVRGDKVLINRLVYIGLGIFSLIWIFGQTDSTLYLGSYSEWRAGSAPIFYEDGTFTFMLVFTLILWGVALIAFVIGLLREGKTV